MHIVYTSLVYKIKNKSLMIVPGSKYFENLLGASFRGPTSIWGPKVDFLNIHYRYMG